MEYKRLEITTKKSIEIDERRMLDYGKMDLKDLLDKEDMITIRIAGEFVNRDRKSVV